MRQPIQPQIPAPIFVLSGLEVCGPVNLANTFILFDFSCFILECPSVGDSSVPRRGECFTQGRVRGGGTVLKMSDDISLLSVYFFSSSSSKKTMRERGNKKNTCLLSQKKKIL